MRIFISYKFADEKPEELEDIMKRIKESLEKANHNILTTFFDKEEFEKNNPSMKQIMDKAMGYLDKSDAVLCLIKSNEKSEGQILEIGYAIAEEKNIILAIQKGLKTRWIEHYASKIIEFDNLKDLYKKLESLDL